jgi:hypothetical protein
MRSGQADHYFGYFAITLLPVSGLQGLKPKSSQTTEKTACSAGFAPLSIWPRWICFEVGFWGYQMSAASYRCASVVTAVVLFTLQSAASLAATKVGNASATKNRVEGTLGANKRQLSSGSEVYSTEHIRTGQDSVGDFVFLDNTKLSVGPVSEIRLDKFVYDPDGSNNRVVLNATRGAFRFVTGVLDKRAYAIVTPLGTIGVRGTIFELSLYRGLILHVVQGSVTLTLLNGRVINVPEGEMVTITPQGAVIGPVQAPSTILNFASLDGTTIAGFDTTPLVLGGLAGAILVPVLAHHHHHRAAPVSP